MSTYADQRAHDVTWMTAREREQLDRPRYAVEVPARGWRWTYSNITASEAQEIADSLTAHDGERWDVREIASEHAA
jgi:hypothetical protein